MKTHPVSTESASPTPPGSAGFSLVEVMIALVLLAIAALAIAAAQLHSLLAASDSDNRTQAIYLAQQQLDAFLAMNDNDSGLNAVTDLQDPAGAITMSEALDDEAAGANNPSGMMVDMTQFRRSWTIKAGTPSTGMRTITVKVTWTSAAAGSSGSGTGGMRSVQVTGVR